MKDSSRMKKLIGLTLIVLVALSLSGCTAPVDENKQTIYIWNEIIEGAGTFRTSFQDVISNENWFQALIVYPLTKAINVLSGPLGVGWAIATVTLLVNGILALATLRASIAQQRIQLLQPELDRIQRKYEGRNDQASKMRSAQEMQALYNKYNVNPLSAFLVSFLQFPIIIAMYQAVHRSYAVQTGSFLGVSLERTPLTGIKELFAGNTAGLPYLILFIFMALFQFLSMQIPQWIQKRKAQQEAAKHHRKPAEAPNSMKYMQYYFLVMIIVFGLSWPSAMSLYWAINSLVQILKTLFIQKMIDTKEGA